MADKATGTLESLREATRPMHRRLESAAPLKRLVEPDLTLNEYCGVLERLLGYHDPAEVTVNAHADGLPIDFGPRRKTDLLVRDLERLHYSRREIDDLPRCPDVAPVTDVDSALGVLYVLEGSTLGGRIIRRHLQRSIGIASDAGCAYYTGYGEDTGPMWKALGRAIEERVKESGSAEPVIASARATFIALNKWMTR